MNWFFHWIKCSLQNKAIEKILLYQYLLVTSVFLYFGQSSMGYWSQIRATLCFFCTFASDTLKEIKAEESDVYSATKRTEATQTTFWDKLVQGHVSEKSFSWAFHEHWSFFAETYSLNGAESKKSCLQFFQSHLGLFYAN